MDDQDEMILSRSQEQDLLQKSVNGIGELFALYGKYGAACTADQLFTAEQDGLLGANLSLNNPYYDAAVLPSGLNDLKLELIANEAHRPLPHAIYSLAAEVTGRIPHPHGIILPCMGVDLSNAAYVTQIIDSAVSLPDGYTLIEPSLVTVATINEAAYNITDNIMMKLFANIKDDRLWTIGLADNMGNIVSVAAGLSVEDDVYVHYVATAESSRRKGLAFVLMKALLKIARDKGAKTVTLHATPMGLPLYTKIGFKLLGVLTAFIRPEECN